MKKFFGNKPKKFLNMKFNIPKMKIYSFFLIKNFLRTNIKILQIH